MTPGRRIITEQDIEQLPRAYQVKFAAGCANRVLECFPSSLGSRRRELYDPMERVINLAEQGAAGGVAEGLDDAIEAARHAKVAANTIPTTTSEIFQGGRGSTDKNLVLAIIDTAVMAGLVAKECSGHAVLQVYHAASAIRSDLGAKMETAFHELEMRAAGDKPQP